MLDGFLPVKNSLPLKKTLFYEDLMGIRNIDRVNNTCVSWETASSSSLGQSETSYDEGCSRKSIFDMLVICPYLMRTFRVLPSLSVLMRYSICCVNYTTVFPVGPRFIAQSVGSALICCWIALNAGMRDVFSYSVYMVREDETWPTLSCVAAVEWIHLWSSVIEHDANMQNWRKAIIHQIFTKYSKSD